MQSTPVMEFAKISSKLNQIKLVCNNLKVFCYGANCTLWAPSIAAFFKCFMYVTEEVCLH